MKTILVIMLAAAAIYALAAESDPPKNPCDEKPRLCKGLVVVDTGASRPVA